MSGGYGSFAREDGAFVVGSVAQDDGLAPGKYRATIECWKRPRGDDGALGVNPARGDYRPPELEIKVDAAGPVEYNIDVPLVRQQAA